MSTPPEDEPLQQRNLRLVVAYDGTAYHGWQKQADGLPTVQQQLEQAAARVLGHPVTANGAGRTDAGVHAAGQVANLLTGNRGIPTAKIAPAISSRCPEDIAVLSAGEVPAEFHASMSAIGKTYRYRIHVGPAKPVMRARYVHHYGGPLDGARMAAAASRLLGEHDFRGFASAAEERQNTVRTITSCQVAGDGDELHVTIAGSGFLYHMVRNIVGTLMEIGRGRWQPGRIDEVIRSRDRGLAGPTAPAGGLCLLSVEYPPELTRNTR